MENLPIRRIDYCLLLAWVIALIATIGALYSSEILNMAVCKLCWYQRILMFPLAIQLGIATFKKDKRFAVYALPLTILGGLIALYHYLIQMIPALAPYTPCRADAATGAVSCETIDWQLAGFITFPLLSLIAFAAMTLLLILSLRRR